jgi:hypothetical protein
LFRSILYVGGIILAAFAVGLAIQVITMPARTVVGIAERTLNSDNVIANYEWFKRQYQDIQAFDTKIANAEAAQKAFEQSAGPRETWKFDDRQEWSRLNAVLLGLSNQRRDMVAEYNARTEMANRNLFRTSDLPAIIN